MIRTIIFVVCAGIIISGVVWLVENPGTMTMAWGDLRVDVELVVAFAGLLVFAATVAILYRLWWSARRVPKAISNSRRSGKRERGYKALTQGMVAVAAGDANEAKRQAQKADTLLGDPPLTMLLSAQAAQLNGDEDAAGRYFNAMLKRPETAFLGLRGLLMQAERDGDTTAALSYAGRAKSLQPKTPWVLTTLFDLQVREGQWQGALKTLDQAIKSKAFKPAEGKRLRAAILLGSSIEAEESGNKTAALSFADKAHKEQPDHLPAIVRRAQLMNEAGKFRSLLNLIKDVWSHSPHPVLAKLYVGGDYAPDALTRVKKLEALRDLNPDHPESRIALVQALIDAKIWGAARTHLETLGLENPPSRICRLMAELEEGENADMDAVRQWLMQAARAAPDPAWICSDCGGAHSVWAPLCSRCDELGTLDWRVPEHTFALAKPESESLPVESPENAMLVDSDEEAPKQELLAPDGTEPTPAAVNSNQPR
ncbi:MAG: heme biosynthesis protein HemY [Rhodospirillaceae bacterium]|nr:heme biosynthesis protein HemY [Rhodospirillaceae bacterium]|tara:strand:- start:19426 stop:20874 length:1449 start_codon:yes stop_codon:yes gene_type:complete